VIFVSSKYNHDKSEHIVNDYLELMKENERLKKRITEQLAELACLLKENTLAYRKISKVEESMLNAEKCMEDVLKVNYNLEEKNKQLKKDIVLLKEEVDNLQEEKTLLKSDLQEHIQGEDELKLLIMQLENSKSWKITKPLRTLLYLLKKKI